MNLKPVKRPDRTVIIKNNPVEYVYLTQGIKYSPEIKASRPKRVTIGKLNEEGLLIPNKNYVTKLLKILGNLYFQLRDPKDFYLLLNMRLQTIERREYESASK